MAIYMKYGGIEGDATDDNHQKWITLDTFQWGVGRSVSTPVGSTKNREASEPSVAEVTVTKRMDGSSVYLLEEATTGNKGTKCEINFTTTGYQSNPFARYQLKNALITAYSVSSSGEEPRESITINFTEYEYRYTVIDFKGAVLSNSVTSYDLTTTKKG